MWFLWTVRHRYNIPDQLAGSNLTVRYPSKVYIDIGYLKPEKACEHSVCWWILLELFTIKHNCVVVLLVICFKLKWVNKQLCGARPYRRAHNRVGRHLPALLTIPCFCLPFAYHALFLRLRFMFVALFGRRSDVYKSVNTPAGCGVLVANLARTLSCCGDGFICLMVDSLMLKPYWALCFCMKSINTPKTYTKTVFIFNKL